MDDQDLRETDENAVPAEAKPSDSTRLDEIRESPDDTDCDEVEDSASDVLQLIDRVRQHSIGSESAIFFSAVAGPVADGATPWAGRDPTPVANTSAVQTGALRASIGRFEIHRKLGEGGYGLVFLAHDPQLKRQVALKIPQPQVLMTDYLRVRFLREAEAAAAVDHPNIVSVFEAGSVDGVCYIAYAYCQGVSLAEWLGKRSEPVGPRAAALLIAKLAEAVQHAHSRGVLHRDLKPANVMLETDGQRSVADDETQLAQRARVTDFGLAKLEAADVDATATGSILGTPAYLSPEQAEAGRVTIGPPADVHALGVMLYELLTREAPFRRDTTLATLEAVRNEPAPSLRRLNPRIPVDLEAICLKCLEKDPHRRYASAEALATDLNRWLAGKPIVARPVSTLSRNVMWCKRKPMLAGLMAGLCVSVLIGAAGISWNAYQLWCANNELSASNTNLKDANLRERQARSDAEQNFQDAFAAVDEYLTQVSESDVLRGPGLQPLRQKLLKSAQGYYVKFIATHGNDPKVRRETAAAYLRVGKITAQIGSREEALQKLQVGRGLAQQLFADDDRSEHRAVYAELCLNISLAQRRLGQREAAQESVKQAIELLDVPERNVENSRLLVNSYGSMGVLLRHSRQFPQALAAFDKAIELNASLAVDDPDDLEVLKTVAANLGNRANVLLQMGDLDAGREGMLAVIPIMQKLVDRYPNVPVNKENLSSSFQNLATLNMILNRRSEGLAAFKESVRLGEELIRENPAVTEYQMQLSQSYLGLASTQARLGNPESQKTRDQALPILTELCDSHPDIVDYPIVLAAYHQDSGLELLKQERHEEALERFQEAVKLLRKVLERDPRNGRARSILGTSLANNASALDRQGDYQRALKFWEEAFTFQIGAYEAELRAKYAQTWAHAGNYKQAVVVLQLLPKSNRRSQVPYQTARAYACCVPLVGEDEQLDATTRKQLAEQYAERAIEALKSAAMMGHFRSQKSIEAMYEQADFKSIAADERFVNLLTGLREKVGSDAPQQPE